MLHGTETWPVRKENEVALQGAEMRMVRRMCDVKKKNRISSKELRERLGIDDNLGTTAKHVMMIWACIVSREDAMNPDRWRKLIKDGWSRIGVSRLMFLLVLAHPGNSQTKCSKMVVVTV